MVDEGVRHEGRLPKKSNTPRALLPQGADWMQPHHLEAKSCTLSDRWGRLFSALKAAFARTAFGLETCPRLSSIQVPDLC